MSSQQSEADQFYADCSAPLEGGDRQLFCFGTQDTCTGTATNTTQTCDLDAETDGTADCPAGCDTTPTREGVETQGFWDQASLCETTVKE